MANVFLSLGTNMGNKEQNLSEAIDKIGKQIGVVISQSAFYTTAPWGFTSENSFLNSAIELNTSLSPLDLLIQTQTIEKEMGRKIKSVKGIYSDRIIDIDILLYDDVIYKNEMLELPHPLMTERIFVMEPLVEIAANKIHPVFHKPINTLYKELIRKS